VLLGGLLLSIAVMTVGLGLTAVRGGDATHVVPLHRLIPELTQGHVAAVLDLGILVLFATPLLGVLTALEGFWAEGDRDFVLVSLGLLLVLGVGIAIALR
jgi:uncharacterized membrane protein